jgi:hypothetical protein
MNPVARNTIMAEATWGNAVPAIDWKMSASLEDVARGGAHVPEVTSLGAAVRAWQQLDPDMREAAVLTPERPVIIAGGTAFDRFVGPAIGDLATRLPDDPA